MNILYNNICHRSPDGKPLKALIKGRLIATIIFVVSLFLPFKGNAQQINKFKPYKTVYRNYMSNVFPKGTVLDTSSALTKVGQWGWGPTYNVAAKGNYVYIGNGYLLQVLDISNPASPKIVGELLTGSLVFTVTLSGNYIYTTSPFRIIDVSNPANPVLVNTITLPSGIPPCSAVTVKGNYAYVGDFAGNIYIIDISNPASPQVLGQMQIPGDGVVSVVVKDTILYANSIDNQGIFVFNISNPISPYQIGATGNNIGGLLTVNGNYLYYGTGIYLSIYNISDPSNLTYINKLKVDTLGGFVNHISIIDTIAYLTLASDRIAAVDIADTSNIHIISKLKNPYGSYGTQTAGEAVNFPYDYIATDIGLWTVNVEKPDFIKSISFFPTGGYVNKMTVDSSYHAYLAELSAGLKILDFSDPSSPKLIGQYTTDEQVIDVAVSGKYAYLDCDSSLQIIDVSNPASPKFLSSVSLHDTINSSIDGNLDYLCLDSSIVYAARKSQRLFVIAAADPANPQIKNIYSLRNIPSGICQSNGYLYVAERGGGIGLPTGIQIFNITNPNTPVESGFLTTDINGLTAYKNSLYVFGVDSTEKKPAFEKYDISNPTNPVLKYLVDNNIGGIITVDIKVDKDYAYIVSGNYLLMIDISNIDSGKIVYSANAYTDPNTPGAGTFNSVTAYKGIALTGYLGITVFNNTITSVNDKHNTSPNNFELFQNYPNPFNPSTTIKYQIPKAEHVTLKIYDILGRVVATLVNREQRPGNYEVQFNANSLASGIYFYRLTYGSLSQVKKMIVLK